MGVRAGCWWALCAHCWGTWTTGWTRGDRSQCPNCGATEVRHLDLAAEVGEPKSYFDAIKAFNARQK